MNVKDIELLPVKAKPSKDTLPNKELAYQIGRQLAANEAFRKKFVKET